MGTTAQAQDPCMKGRWLRWTLVPSITQMRWNNSYDDPDRSPTPHSMVSWSLSGGCCCRNTVAPVVLLSSGVPFPRPCLVVKEFYLYYALSRQQSVPWWPWCGSSFRQQGPFSTCRIGDAFPPTKLLLITSAIKLFFSPLIRYFL